MYTSSTFGVGSASLLSVLQNIVFPPYLKIDCDSFLKTVLEKKIEENHYLLRIKTPIEKMDPVVFFLQDFLSSVEVLELSTYNGGISGENIKLYMSFYGHQQPAWPETPPDTWDSICNILGFRAQFCVSRKS